MVAMQIAAEPLVRQSLRQAFQSRAVVCVKPTKKGRKVQCSHIVWVFTSMYVCSVVYVQSYLVVKP